MLSATQSTALGRGISFLRAAGLRFAVEMPDLSIQGSLPVAKEAPPAIKSRQKLASLDAKYGYRAKVDTLKPGELLAFEVDLPEDAKRLASNMAARGIQKFGAGNCISHYHGLHAELLRVT